MTANKRQKWIIAVLSIITLLAVAVYLFDWNMLRGFVERRVSNATGREFRINGDLDVDLSWQPRITANDVMLANADWSQEPWMARLRSAEVVVNLRSLFSDNVLIPSIKLGQPHLVLEKNPQGVGNWVFDKDDGAQENGKNVAIHDLQIDAGQVAYRSPPDKADVVVAVSSQQDSTTNKKLLQVNATGTYNGLDTKAEGTVGAITGLEDLQQRYPIQLRGNVGKTSMEAQGTINNLLQFDGLDLKFKLSGGSLADLFPLIGVPLPATAQYSIAGQLAQSGQTWDLPQFSGKVGNSDVRGQFAVDRGVQPQFIRANLQSDNLDLEDLAGFIGGRTESGKKIVDPKRVLPNSPFSFEKLHAANADVQFKGRRIKTQRLPIDDMTTHLKLKDGRLLLDPLNFGVADGDIRTTINLDSTQSPINTQADIQLRKIRLDQLFPGFKFEKANAGVIGGRAKFVSHGNSVAQMLGSANGQIAFMMYGGSVSQLVVRLANLDVANAVLVLLGGDKSVPIRCMVTDLEAKDGDMQVRTMVLDTTKAIITGRGHINFKDETIDLRLDADSKGPSLVALRGPIDIKGTFKDPNPGPALKNVSGRVAVAAALGALAGPLAFIPLVDFGGGEDSDCAGLLRDAEQRSNRPAKPEPVVKLMNYGESRIERTLPGVKF